MFSEIDASWTLFLDRDGVINERIPGDYVKAIEEFKFLPGVLEALAQLSTIFRHIVIVTNQQGIGKGAMTDAQLQMIHAHMLTEISLNYGRVDAIFHCPGKAEDNPLCRKPNTGMADQAKSKFPEIDFERSLMVGDSETDMEFASRKGMQHVFIGENERYVSFPSLFHVAMAITSR